MSNKSAQQPVDLGAQKDEELTDIETTNTFSVPEDESINLDEFVDAVEDEQEEEDSTSSVDCTDDDSEDDSDDDSEGDSGEDSDSNDDDASITLDDVATKSEGKKMKEPKSEGMKKSNSMLMSQMQKVKKLVPVKTATKAFEISWTRLSGVSSKKKIKKANPAKEECDSLTFEESFSLSGRGSLNNSITIGDVVDVPNVNPDPRRRLNKALSCKNLRNPNKQQDIMSTLNSSTGSLMNRVKQVKKSRKVKTATEVFQINWSRISCSRRNLFEVDDDVDGFNNRDNKFYNKNARNSEDIFDGCSGDDDGDEMKSTNSDEKQLLEMLCRELEMTCD